MFKIFKTIKKPVKHTYPFDVEKAYIYHRQGLMTGASCEIQTSPDDLIQVYSYSKPVSELEDGMRDRGATVYFVGLKAGTAQVDVITYYPTCPKRVISFKLEVSEDGKVTKIE